MLEILIFPTYVLSEGRVLLRSREGGCADDLILVALHLSTKRGQILALAHLGPEVCFILELLETFSLLLSAATKANAGRSKGSG